MKFSEPTGPESPLGRRQKSVKIAKINIKRGMPSQIPNNKNYSLPERLPARRDFQPGGVFYTKPPRKKRPLGWKIGLGIGAAILLLTFVLFNQQIGQLLNWIGIKAQKPGGPQITLFLDPVEQGGGPSDTVQYTVNIQIEQGTYLNALDPLDPNNGAPLPFLGDISFNVDNLASLYPEFIESANITVPIEDPALPGNNPAMPWITVLDDVNAFGLLTNRRLTPPDLGFITTPPILTITLKNYPLEHGGFPINFQVGATVNYLPSMGVISVTPPPGQEPTVDDPIPANGILNLEGGIPPQPDFSLVITPKTLDVNSGETAVYDIAVGSLNDFSGDVVLTVPGLDGYKITCLDGFTLLPGTLTLAAGETKHSTLTIFTTSGLKDIFTVPIQVHGSSMIWILELDPDTGGTKLVLKEVIHDDNATLTINPLQDYSLAIVPPTITIAPGGTAVYTIELTRTSNFTGPVTLTTDLTIPSLNPNLESAIFSDTIL